MVVKFQFLTNIREIDIVPKTFEELTSLIQNMLGYDNIDKLTFEYTFDEKQFFLLNNETYDKFYNNNNQNSHIYMHCTYEESNYYKQEENGIENIKNENYIISEEKDKENKEEDNNINENNINENNIESDNYIISEKEKEENFIINNNNNNNNIIREEKENLEDKKEEIIIENNNLDNKINENDKNEIKLPEITKEMVIASILKGVKERRQQSKIQLEKERKEKLKKEKEKKKKERAKKKEEKKVKKKEEKDAKKEKDFAGEINNMINNRIEEFKKDIINESQMKLSQIIISQSHMEINNNENNNEIHSLEKHPDIICCKCGMNPIIGNRYCCIQCDNVNFCDKCEEEIGYDHAHPLYKFKLRIE